MSDALYSDNVNSTALLGGGGSARLDDPLVCDTSLLDRLRATLKSTEEALDDQERWFHEAETNANWAAGLAGLSIACRIFIVLGKLSGRILDARLKLPVFEKMYEVAEGARALHDGEHLQGAGKLVRVTSSRGSRVGKIADAVSLAASLQKVYEAMRKCRDAKDPATLGVAMAELSLELKRFGLELGEAVKGELDEEWKPFKYLLDTALDVVALVDGLRADLRALDELERERGNRREMFGAIIRRLRSERMHLRAYVGLLESRCGALPLR